ncbi:uncharacterized protein METZ01_LOCUS94936, partial [marine metagenome]
MRHAWQHRIDDTLLGDLVVDQDGHLNVLDENTIPVADSQRARGILA